LEPLLFYVLHRAQTSIYNEAFAGTFKVFVVDEAWRFLRHPAIRRYVEQALKTWRKKNAGIILATQSADDLLHSEMLPVVLESCATQIFLANPGMDKAAYREAFHLSETEADQVAMLAPKRQFLLKRATLSKILNLNLERSRLS
jgi:type IV secretory pathway VirB4 component